MASNNLSFMHARITPQAYRGKKSGHPLYCFLAGWIPYVQESEHLPQNRKDTYTWTTDLQVDASPWESRAWSLLHNSSSSKETKENSHSVTWDCGSNEILHFLPNVACQNRSEPIWKPKLDFSWIVIHLNQSKAGLSFPFHDNNKFVTAVFVRIRKK